MTTGSRRFPTGGANLGEEPPWEPLRRTFVKNPCEEPQVGYTESNRCPSFSFFVFRYFRVCSEAGTSSGSHSSTDRP
jgi:hypothetical protein